MNRTLHNSIELIQLGLINADLWEHLKFKTKATYQTDENWLKKTSELVEQCRNGAPLVGGSLSTILQRVCNITAATSKALAISHVIRLKDESENFVTPYTVQADIRLMLQLYEQPLILDQDSVNELFANCYPPFCLTDCALKHIGEPFKLKINRRDLISILSPIVEICKANIPLESLTVIYAPLSKSETNRALILAALSKRIVKLESILESEDTVLMIQALKRCGVRIHASGQSLLIHGTGGLFEQPSGPIYLGNSGTSMRFLTAAIALNGNHEYILEGNERMSKRPIADLVDALNNSGCSIEYLATKGYPPLRITKRREDISDRINVNDSMSSQYVSGILMGLSTLNKAITINVISNLVSKSFVSLTVQMMRAFGVGIEEKDNTWIIHPADLKTDNHNDHERNEGIGRSTGNKQNKLSTSMQEDCAARVLQNEKYDVQSEDVFRYEIAADATSCSYLVAIAALANQPIHIPNLTTANEQGDIRLLLNICPKFGLDVKITDNGFYCAPPKHGVIKNGGVIDLDSSDTFMTFAVLAAFAEGETKIVNIKNQAIKECSRIKVTAENLQKAGVDVEHDDDSITIVGKESPNYNDVTVECHNDHRIAMSFAVFASRVKNVRLSDAWCVEKTFPYFWQAVRRFGIETSPVIT